MRARGIVIAGAGIGGLTAALALVARGCSVVVLEKTPALQVVGAGVQLSPNATRILVGLGLQRALAPRATAPSVVVLNSVRAGGEVARLPVPQSHDAPYWVIHRADLQAALAEAVAAHPAIELRLGVEVTASETLPEGVRVVAAGSAIDADVLIAADGVASSIRQKFFPNAAPIRSGWTAWRGMADGGGAAEVRLWWARGAHLVAYPVAGSTRTNLVLTLADGIQPAETMEGWPDAPRDLVAAAGPLTPYPLATVPPMPRWTHGRIALLGDSAHAMLPFAAQGAGMAIEDAAVLAECLASDHDAAQVLASYAARRIPRVGQVASAARQSGRIYHMGAPLDLARDIAIRLRGSASLMKRQDWIYDWRP